VQQSKHKAKAQCKETVDVSAVVAAIRELAEVYDKKLFCWELPSVEFVTYTDTMCHWVQVMLEVLIISKADQEFSLKDQTMTATDTICKQGNFKNIN
jgi:hypothetical protein